VFLDETAITTSMVRTRGRCPRGDRLVDYTPHGHWKTVTFMAGLRHDQMVAPFVIEGAMNGETFLAYIEQCLAPTLKPGDIVVLDNVSTHKVNGVVETIEAVGATLRYLPQYSPDLYVASPHMFSCRPEPRDLQGGARAWQHITAPYSVRKNSIKAGRLRHEALRTRQVVGIHAANARALVSRSISA
jgi:DDE superfamily endonuclease